ncbi:uncharacterized protein [Dermacentor albipictus]|uniref:uncharacterized protein isoform X3 n=1 Tax=Dermacentor albipictus TaxID=60249 RepID=UPI0038FC4CCE
MSVTTSAYQGTCTAFVVFVVWLSAHMSTATLSNFGVWPGILEERVKPLWCVYDNRVDERPWRFLPRDIPTAQCTSVVYTYLGLSPGGRNLTSYKPNFDFGPAGLSAVSALKRQHERPVRLRALLAVGGPDTDSRLFEHPVEGTEGARSALMANAEHWLRVFDFDGLLVHIDRPESFTTSDYTINEFVFAMYEFMKTRDKFFSVILPADKDRRSAYFSPYAYAQKLEAFVVWSHDLVVHPREPTCPSPLNTKHKHHGPKVLSLAELVDSVGASYATEEEAHLVMSRMMLTFSLAGFYFDLEQPNPRHRGHPHPPLPREVMLESASYVAYHQICGDKQWNTTYNAVTGCVEMIGENGWISYPGRPRRELLAIKSGWSHALRLGHGRLRWSLREEPCANQDFLELT